MQLFVLQNLEGCYFTSLPSPCCLASVVFLFVFFLSVNVIVIVGLVLAWFLRPSNLVPLSVFDSLVVGSFFKLHRVNCLFFQNKCCLECRRLSNLWSPSDISALLWCSPWMSDRLACFHRFLFYAISDLLWLPIAALQLFFGKRLPV